MSPEKNNKIADQINWGMIGIGNVTEKKSGPAFSKVPNSKLIAVMGRNAEKAADYAGRHNVPSWYDNVRDLIDDPRINAVYIATPPDVHLEYATMAMLAGKAVYVEKPMALNAAECELMNQVSKDTGVPLFVAYYRRALPYFIQLKQLIDQNTIGDIRCVNIKVHKPLRTEDSNADPRQRWRVSPEISGGGYFHDLASHQFDFLEYIFGELVTATGISGNQAGVYDADDIVIANFRFQSGILGTGSWCFTVNKEQQIDETQIIGSHGRISFSFFDNFIITVEREEGTQTFNLPYPEHVQQPLIDLVVKELRGEGKCPSTGVTAARANWILDQIARQG